MWGGDRGVHRGCRQLDSPSLQKSHCGPLPLPHSLTFPLGQRRRGSGGRRTQPPCLESVFTRTSDLWARPFPTAPRTLPAPLAAQGRWASWGSSPFPELGPAWCVAGDTCPPGSAQLPMQDSQWLIIGRLYETKFEKE